MLRHTTSALLLASVLFACGVPPAAVGPRATGGANTSTAAPSLEVDDFEDGDGQSLLGSYWYVHDDSDNGGGSSIEVARASGGGLAMEGEGFESERSLLAKLRMDKGELPYPPYVGLGVGLAQEHGDLSHYGALEYTYKGGKHEVRIETANVEDWDFYAVQVPASASWKTVTLELSLFRQGGWGAKVPLALDRTTALSWQVREGSGYAGDFQLDGVRLIAAASQEAKPPNLEVHDPAPPKPTKLDSIAITHPLQQLAMQSLNRGYNITNWLEQARFDSDATYNEAFVNKLADAGFESLRLPIDLDLYVVERGGKGKGDALELDPVLFEVLDNFDRWTAARGLSLTIDYHQYDESLDIEDPQSTGEMVALWGEVAAHFAKSPRKDLFYELLNEPELAAGKRGPTAQEWTELSTRMIAAIRKHDPTRPILFGDVKWYGIDELAARRPFDDPNIIYVFHFYDPFIFTHQGAPWAGMGTTRDIPYPYSRERWSDHLEDFGFSELNESWQLDQLHNYHRGGTRDALRNRLVTAKAWAVEHDVPVICNEFGAHESSARKEDVLRYYAELTALFEELEIPWQLWFMIMDAETGELDPEYRDALRL